MTLNDILKSLNFFKILSENQPILLNHFIAKVVNEIFDKVDHSLIEKICWSVEW